jgi:predicted Zn-dependent peptidase
MKSNITLINDDKFKSIFISVNFLRELKKEENAKNALLASILKKGTQNLRTEKEIELELSKLYASSIDVNVEKIGAIYNIEFGAEYINKKYIDEDVSEKVLNILHDIIYAPYLENGMFSKEIFDREKDSLIERINQEKNDKRRWSLVRLEQEMYDDNDYGTSVYGSEEDIRKETVESIFEYYNQFIKNSEIRIIVVGNLDGYNNLEEILKNQFLNTDVIISKKDVKNREDFRKIEEHEKLNQSVLCLGLNVKNTGKDLVPIVTVYNSILGTTPASKLFQNVREKESLAYFAKSQYNKYINAIYIYSGINLSNVDKATKVIYEQIDDMKRGNISEEEINTAKKNIILTYKAITDSKVTLARTMLANSLYTEEGLNINEFINSIERVTIEDVVNIAKEIDINTIYLLGGDMDE